MAPPESGGGPLSRAEAERLLEARLAQVRGRSSDLKKPPERGASIGFGKRIGDGTAEAIGRLTDVGVAGSLDAIEARVERALVKLDEGTYGVCDSCGAEIPPQRLRAVPESSLCVTCAGSGRRGGR